MMKLRFLFAENIFSADTRSALQGLTEDACRAGCVVSRIPKEGCCSILQQPLAFQIFKLRAENQPLCFVALMIF